MPRIVQLSLFDSKLCARCQQWRERESFGTSKANLDGLRSWCRACDRAYRREWEKNNPDRVAASKRREYERHKERYQAYKGQWYQENREWQLTRLRRNYALNKERYREMHRAHYLRNRDKYLAGFREYRARNSEAIKAMGARYYQENRERLQARHREYCKANPHIIRMCWHRRRARERGAEGAHTIQEWKAMVAWFGSVCLACGAHENLTRDHVVPLACGGGNAIDNLQPLCLSCNSAKSATIADYRHPDRLTAFLASLA